MASIEYNVAGQQIAVTKDAELVENTVGVYDVKFTFDSSWSSFTDKTAVFVSDTHPDAPYEVPLDANSEALIPAAVLKYGNLMIGVYGSTQTQQYPTVWAPPKRVWPGAGPGMEPPADPVFGMVVRTAPQELTSEQQSNARTNIGAAGSSEMTTALAGKMDKDTDGVVGNITVIDTNHNAVDSGTSLLNIYERAMIHHTASGSIISIKDGADSVPIKQMQVSGVSGTNCGIIQKSKNLFNPSNLLVNTGISTTEATLGEWTSTTVYDCSNYIDVRNINSVTIRVMKTTTGGQHFRCCGYNENHVAIELAFSQTITGTGVREKTVDTTNYAYIAVMFAKTSFNNGNTWWITETSNVYTINFPSSAGTVSDGTLSIKEDGTGVLESGGSSYALTDTPIIQTLYKENNVWASTGSVTMIYRADPTVAESESADAIRKTIAPIEDGATASQAYAVGSFLYRNGTLYKVTSAISSGGTFTVGTNIDATTVAEQLIALA